MKVLILVCLLFVNCVSAEDLHPDFNEALDNPADNYKMTGKKRANESNKEGYVENYFNGSSYKGSKRENEFYGAFPKGSALLSVPLKDNKNVTLGETDLVSKDLKKTYQIGGVSKLNDIDHTIKQLVRDSEAYKDYKQVQIIDIRGTARLSEDHEKKLKALEGKIKDIGGGLVVIRENSDFDEFKKNISLDLDSIKVKNKITTVEASNVDKKTSSSMNEKETTTNKSIKSNQLVKFLGDNVKNIGPLYSVFSAGYDCYQHKKSSKDFSTKTNIQIDASCKDVIKDSMLQNFSVLGFEKTSYEMGDVIDKTASSTDKLRWAKSMESDYNTYFFGNKKAMNDLKSQVEQAAKLKTGSLYSGLLFYLKMKKDSLENLYGKDYASSYSWVDKYETSPFGVISYHKAFDIKKDKLQTINSNIVSNPNTGTGSTLQSYKTGSQLYASPNQIPTQLMPQQLNTNNSLPSSNSLNNGNGAVISHSGSVTAIGITGTDVVNKAQNGAKSQFTLGTNTNTTANRDITAIGITGGSAVNDADGDGSKAKLRIGGNGGE